MNRAYKAQGWTLVELMITVAIIGVLASIAVPAYNNYIEAGESSVTSFNLRQLATFEENYFYEAGDYLYGSYTPPGVNPFTAIGWSPDGDNNLFIYEVVTAGSCPGGGICATINVKLVRDPTTVVQTMDLERG